ncbi:hypothetical protein TNCT_673561 [Trichonephila clavata]|uniref:Uncharacterized protein n=1 Tax=Trichonephila clavata TaxID=2740835 RepID=A0A8X6IN93_TRICU|nr:hypothetical protein TNCT_673561 [Trichonephila clavata]
MMTSKELKQKIIGFVICGRKSRIGGCSRGQLREKGPPPHVPSISAICRHDPERGDSHHPGPVCPKKNTTSRVKTISRHKKE